MKKSILLLLVLVACSTASLEAQKFNFGVRGGLNISSLGDYEHPIGVYEDSELDNRLGPYAGLFVQYHITNQLGLESGLFYSQLGGKDKENDYDESYKITANPSYLQIPLTVFYKIDITNKFKFYPDLGIYAGYGIGGKMKTEGTIMNENVDSDLTYFDDFAREFDFGGTVGVNLEYNKFILSVNYDQGFTRVNKTKVKYEDNAYNSNLRITLGYIF